MSQQNIAMNRTINITEIPRDVPYEGYLWMSDKKEPVKLEEETLGELLNGITDNSNPFVVEGQLYCSTAKKSYSIKYVDGEHIVIEYDFEKRPEDWFHTEDDDKAFITNRLVDISKIKFRQFWKPEPDELCNGMNVLVPAAYVFVGFEYNKKKEEK